MVSLLISSLLLTQQPQHFRIKVAGGALTGTEDFTLTAVAQGGWRLTGSARITRGGGVTDLVQDALLPEDFSPGHYRLTVTTAGTSQSIEAWREGDSVRIKASAGGTEHTATVPAGPRMLFLDNLVVSHFQLLLLRWAQASEPERTEAWRLIVPQGLTAITGRLTPGAEETDTLDGQPLRVRRLTLEAAGLVVELWAAADDYRLLRVTVPVQRVEMVREGFAAGPAAPEPTAPCDEQIATVRSGAIALPGTYCAPREVRAPFPVVVFVAGSGPNDRDETLGPNKPLRDFAWGLATRGIASLRYDKRTYALRGTGQLDPVALTVQEEVIDDAVAAVRLARTLPGADPARVFLAGHSLGGTLGPLVAEAGPGLLRGLVLLAPGARPLDSVIVEQTAYRMQVAGQDRAAIAAQSAALQAQFTRVRSGAAADSEIVLGASARYWRDLFARRPLDALRALSIPVLVLQGGKDYQVTRADFERIQAALAGKPVALAQTLWLADLNHLFMRVEGASTGAEYGRPGAVDPAALDALATWVQRLR